MLLELATCASLSPTSIHLLALPTSPTPLTISTVYLCAGYTPTDYYARFTPDWTNQQRTEIRES
jgi:hypothetical protein